MAKRRPSTHFCPFLAIIREKPNTEEKCAQHYVKHLYGMQPVNV